MIESFIPEQPLVFEDVIDDDGRGNGPFTIKLSLWREDGKAIIDFAGSSPQAEGPINLFMGETMFKMMIGIVLIMALDPDILFNPGYNDLLDIRFPKGSIVQPDFPAPLSNRAHTLARIIDVLQGALASRTRRSRPAPPAARARTSSTPAPTATASSSSSTRSTTAESRAGRSATGSTCTRGGRNFTRIPVEYAESYFPLRVESSAQRTDSGGAGVHRGGNGLEKVYEFLEPGEVSIHDDRSPSTPWGIGGGRRPNARAKSSLSRTAPKTRCLRSSIA